MLTRVGIIQHLVEDIAMTLIHQPRKRCNSAHELGKTGYNVGWQFMTVADQVLENDIA